MLLVLAPALLVFLVGGVAVAASDQPAPTPWWMNFYSPDSVWNDRPLPVGSVVRAYDPQGVLSGEFVVTRAGRYGLMPVYADDPTTPEDEGALPGDVLRFTVDGETASTTPAVVRWTAMGELQRVDLGGR
ncbi:MAG: hypothetical protein ABIG98_07385 [Chloroflexota bacterium]